MGSHWIIIYTIMKIALSKENNLGTFVAFLAEGYPSGVSLEKFYSSAELLAARVAKFAGLGWKAWMLMGELIFWALKSHPELPLALAETFLHPCPT